LRRNSEILKKQTHVTFTPAINLKVKAQKRSLKEWEKNKIKNTSDLAPAYSL